MGSRRPRALARAGGQAATFDVGDGTLLERYYHHLVHQRHAHHGAVPGARGRGSGGTRRACRSSPAGKRIRSPARSTCCGSRPSPFSSRVRMGLAVVNLKVRHPEVEPFESRTAHDWIVSSMGRQAWDRVWGPLMRGKFGDRAEDVSMAWLWARLTVRRQVKGSEARGEMLGYPNGSFERLFTRLRERDRGPRWPGADRPSCRPDQPARREVRSRPRASRLVPSRSRPT